MVSGHWPACEMRIAEPNASPLRERAADALRRARALPVGSDRNDLRQLAIGLLWLDKRGLAEHASRRLTINLSAARGERGHHEET
jgi:hypothetical protein